MPIRINRPAFEKLVAETLDGLPDEYARVVKNVAILVRESPTSDDLLSVGLDPEHDTLLGLYQGVPLRERGQDSPLLPDQIVIFRQPILRECETREQVVAEVRTTVIHELGHYIGLDEDELPT